VSQLSPRGTAISLGERAQILAEAEAAAPETSVSTVAVKYSLSPSTLYAWRRAESGPKRRLRRFSKEEKAEIVAECAQPGNSVPLVAKKYGIPESRVYEWRRQGNDVSVPVPMAAEPAVLKSTRQEINTDGREIDNLGTEATGSKERFARVQCPICGSVSHDRNDIEHRYCGKCGLFWADPSSLVSAVRRLKVEFEKLSDQISAAREEIEKLKRRVAGQRDDEPHGAA